MTNNESERKTWIMLKRSVQLKNFTSNIIPIFNSTNTGTDDYGTWKITLDKCSSNSWANDIRKAMWKWFDGDVSTNLQVSPKDYGATYSEFILELPETILIKPDYFRIYYYPADYKDYHDYYTIWGFNPQTQEWEECRAKFDTQWYESRNEPSIGQNFYSKFKICVDKNYDRYATRAMYSKEFQIVEGTIKMVK